MKAQRLDDVGRAGLKEAEQRARAPHTDTTVGGAAIQNARDGIEHDGDNDLGVANEIELEIARGDLLNTNSGSIRKIEIVTVDEEIANRTIGTLEQSGRLGSVGVPSDNRLVFGAAIHGMTNNTNALKKMTY